MPDDPKPPSAISIDDHTSQTAFETLPSEVRSALNDLERTLNRHHIGLIAVMLAQPHPERGIAGCFTIPDSNIMPRAQLFSMIAETAEAFKKRLQQ